MKLSLHFALLIISIVRISAPCCANNPSEQLISLANGLMPEAKNNFTLTHDLSSISIKDSKGYEWDGGYYTQNPVVKLRLLSTETEVSYVRVAIEKCNGIVRADYTYKFLEDAVKDNSKDIDITTLNNGESVEYDVSIPGRYCLAYCAIDVYNNPFYTGEIRFDSLYDDGNWSICGQAELSSGVLSSDNHLSHVFSSNGSGFMEEPGDFIW